MALSLRSWASGLNRAIVFVYLLFLLVGCGAESGVLNVAHSKENTLGYAGFDSVLAQIEAPDVDKCHLKMARMVNRAGRVVSVTANSIVAAMASSAAAFAHSDCQGFGLCTKIHDADHPDSWPISTLTYVIVPTITRDDEEGCDEMKAVYDYVKWIMVDPEAESIARRLGFASLPANIVTDAMELLDRMQCTDSSGAVSLVKDRPTRADFVHGRGSSVQRLLQTELTNAFFYKERVNIHYVPTSSGQGRASLRAFECHFSGSESILDMSDPEFIRRGMQMLPLFAAGVAVLYNLHEVDDLVLSRSAVNKLFLGDIVSWDHPEIVQHNPHIASLLPQPREMVLRVVRKTKSGTTTALTQALYSFADLPSGSDLDYSLHPLGGSGLPDWPRPAAFPEDVVCRMVECRTSKCKAGHFHDRTDATCDPCPPGTYINESGYLFSCFGCPPDTYAEFQGSIQCTSCPLHSSRSGGQAGLAVSEADCECSAGWVDLGILGRCAFPLWSLVLLLLLCLLPVVNRVCSAAVADDKALAAAVKEVRARLGLLSHNGVLLSSEAKHWSSIWLCRHRRLIVRDSHLEAAARLALLLPFEPAAVDALTANVSYLHVDTGGPATSRSVLRPKRGEPVPYNELRALVLDASVALLNPADTLDPSTLPLDGHGVHRESVGHQDSRARFDYFEKIVARLHIWKERESELFEQLKDQIQEHEQLLTQMGNELFGLLQTEDGASDLVGLHWDDDDDDQDGHAEMEWGFKPESVMLPVSPPPIERPNNNDSSGHWISDTRINGWTVSDMHPAAASPRSPKGQTAVAVPAEATIQGPLDSEAGQGWSAFSSGRSQPSSPSALLLRCSTRTPPASRSPCPAVDEASHRPPEESSGSMPSVPTNIEDLFQSAGDAQHRTRGEGGDGSWLRRSHGGADDQPGSHVRSTSSGGRLLAQPPSRSVSSPREMSAVPPLLTLQSVPSPMRGHRRSSSAAPRSPSPRRWWTGVGRMPCRQDDERVGAVREATTDRLEEDLLVKLALAGSDHDAMRDETSRGNNTETSRLPLDDTETPRGVDVLQVMEGAYIQQLHRRALVLDATFQDQLREALKMYCADKKRGAWDKEFQIVEGRVKTVERMRQKIVTYRHEELPSPLAAHILDPVRATIVAGSAKAIVDVTRWFLYNGQSSDLPVVRLKNKFAIENASMTDGYRDMMLCVLHTGKHGLRIIGEVQIIERRMYRLKHKMHKLYKVKRAEMAHLI